MFDNELMLRASSAGDLTATGNGAYKDVYPQDVPLVIRVVVPSASGTSPTLDLVFTESDDGSTAKEKHTMPQITAKGEYHLPVRFKRQKVRYEATVGGTTPNFGAVQIGVVPAGRYTDL